MNLRESAIAWRKRSLSWSSDRWWGRVVGMSGILEPPVNDVWSVSGEVKMLGRWKKEDVEQFSNTNPLVSGEDGRKTVKLFTAILPINP